MPPVNTPAPLPPPVTHYENFPVASVLCPPHLRAPIAAIYAFARTADDLADEGTTSPAERLSDLAAYRLDLQAIATGGVPSDRWTHVFAPLAAMLRQHALPVPLLADLLSAFVQDVEKTRDHAGYATRSELLDYCRRSADPVGRLLLHLFGAATPANLHRSDAICSALQLINHWQDVGIDLGKGHNGRIYLPQDDMNRFNVTENDLRCRRASADFRALMRFQVERARALMLEGAPLGRALPGRIGLEIRAIVAGGLRILAKIEAAGYDVFNNRPVLGPFDWPRILWKAL